MSTRCLTKIYDYDGTEICCIYRHHDGYPEGHGQELKAFLKDKKLVNGFGMNDDRKKVFNGMGDCAAAIVAHFYPQTSIYLYPPGSSDMWEEYNYEVRGKLGEGLQVKITEA